MRVYSDYLDEVETRRQQGLNPKPIEDAALIKEIISHIEDEAVSYTHLTLPTISVV